MDPLNPPLGSMIRKLRVERGLSQRELAKLLGISQKTVSSYERNYRLPASTDIPRVAEILHTTPDSLYGTAGEEPGRPLEHHTIWEIVEKLTALPEASRREVLELINNYLESRTKQ